jgi:alkylated DNA repair protein alkB family protein 8
MLRILAPNGVCLIYVWAKEQSERTFEESDCLVPWTKKDKTYQRFYHVFEEGELETLVTSVTLDSHRFEIERSYYDKANWVVIARKTA